MCTIARGNRNILRIRRSVEFLGFHRKDSAVRIVQAIYLERLRAEGAVDDDYLYLLHQGNVKCTAIPAWPSPKHPDERSRKGARSLLSRFYQQAFEEDADGCVRQTQGLTSWDEWVPMRTRQPVRFWPALKSFGKQRSVGVAPWYQNQKLLPYLTEPTKYIPFTAWRLGPFSDAGAYLVNLVLEFSGETFLRLVGSQLSFSVDGPRRLFQTILFSDLAMLPNTESSVWRKELELFADFLPSGTGYDVLVLGPPFADSVEAVTLAGIMQAPRPTSETGDVSKERAVSRYITADLDFSLSMKFRGLAARQRPALLARYAHAS